MMRAATSRLSRGAIIALFLAVSLVWSSMPAAALSTAPVYAGDFPDPFLLVMGNTYWAYATGSAGRNLQVMSSTDLTHWTSPADPLPTLPSWAQTGLTWAPGVIRNGATFLMYYTVHDAASGQQCISVAASPTPGGPFTDSSSSPLLCQHDHGGSIDPSPMSTSTGTYLQWKSDDNAIGQSTHLWSQRLSADGRSLLGAPSLLLTEDSPWQSPNIEGPSMFAVGPLYYLFYGAAPWYSASAGIGYALCTSALGPCVDMSRSGAWMASHGEAVGPSGPAIFTDSTGSTSIAYHAWTGAVGYEYGGVRSLWIDRLSLIGVPIVS